MTQWLNGFARGFSTLEGNLTNIVTVLERCLKINKSLKVTLFARYILINIVVVTLGSN